jgi:hypothetical protein
MSVRWPTHRVLSQALESFGSGCPEQTDSLPSAVVVVPSQNSVGAL